MALIDIRFVYRDGLLGLEISASQLSGIDILRAVSAQGDLVVTPGTAGTASLLILPVDNGHQA